MIKDLNIRQTVEQREERLSPFAQKSGMSRGRQRSEEPDPVRTSFQRDRDRIVHCKAFRRLKHKTQVFIAPLGDHYVTRLTHTLEVAQVARTIARALNLNEDLTEAIALGHDLGHTPFGHVGEEVLNELYPPGFRHNEQSRRIVDRLEKDGRGLNLTLEVRDGIVQHSKTGATVLGEGWGRANTLEGEAVKIGDIVAYINHDIEDAVRAGIITPDDLPSPATAVVGHSHSERINTMVCDIIEHSWPASGAVTSNEYTEIGMSPPVREATETLRAFLFERVYNLHTVEEETGQVREVIRSLYQYFKQHEDRLPVEYSVYGDEIERRVVDYIAGMTDRYALRMAEELSLLGNEAVNLSKKLGFL